MKLLVQPLPSSHTDYINGYRWELCLVDNHADGARARDVATHRWTMRTRDRAESEARRFARNFKCAAVLLEGGVETPIPTT